MADIDFLARHASADPHKAALISSGRSVDFKTLNQRADQAADVFQKLDCKSRDRVAVMSFRT